MVKGGKGEGGKGKPLPFPLAGLAVRVKLTCGGWLPCRGQCVAMLCGVTFGLHSDEVRKIVNKGSDRSED